MTDREMLELAARAAGYKFKMPEDKSTKAGAILGTDWNPLKNKADAFDLMVKLRLFVLPYQQDKAVCVARLNQPDIFVYWNECNNDPATATMLAITRAAAEIGRAMNTTGEQK